MSARCYAQGCVERLLTFCTSLLDDGFFLKNPILCFQLKVHL